MISSTQKTRKTIHPAAAAAAGVVIGVAGAAVTAALVHEPTRKMMGKKLNDAKLQVSKTIKDLQTSSEPVVKKAQDKMKEVSGKLKDTSKTLDDTGSEYME